MRGDATRRTPRRLADERLLLSVELVEAREEERGKMVRARARNTLHRGETLLLHNWRVRSKEQLAREIAELR